MKFYFKRPSIRVTIFCSDLITQTSLLTIYNQILLSFFKK